MLTTAPAVTAAARYPFINAIVAGSACKTRRTEMRYTQAVMRRSIAIALTLLFGWLLLVPAFAAAAESGVAACCRRTGKHHCMARMHSSSTEISVASLNSKCPCVPQATVAAHVEFSAPSNGQAIYAGLLGHPAISPQTEAGYRVSHFRSRQKRGPPALFL